MAIAVSSCVAWLPVFLVYVDGLPVPGGHVPTVEIYYRRQGGPGHLQTAGRDTSQIFEETGHDLTRSHAEIFKDDEIKELGPAKAKVFGSHLVDWNATAEKHLKRTCVNGLCIHPDGTFSKSLDSMERDDLQLQHYDLEADNVVTSNRARAPRAVTPRRGQVTQDDGDFPPGEPTFVINPPDMYCPELCYELDESKKCVLNFACIIKHNQPG